MTTYAGAAEKSAPGQVFTGQHDRRKVTDWVYEQLKTAIVELRLVPGQALREAALASQLGVSKTPIREALAKLEQEGLVRTASFRGAEVTGYSRQDLAEIYELRELLEIVAVRSAATSMSEADRARLDQVVRECAGLRTALDTTRLTALISEFDDILFEQVRNSRIRALIANLRAHLTRIGQLTAGIPGRVVASVDEHQMIMDAIAARDPERAQRYMRAHIRSVRDDQLRALTTAAGSVPGH